MQSLILVRFERNEIMKAWIKSISIITIGTSLVLTLPSLFFAKSAIAQTTGACGLTVPKENKGFVITMYSNRRDCPPTKDKMIPYNSVTVDPPYPGIVMCGSTPPPGYIVTEQRYMPDCSLHGNTSEENNAIMLDKKPL
jgi:hypothetical protein